MTDINRHLKAKLEWQARDIDPEKVPQYIIRPTWASSDFGVPECDTCGGKRGNRRPMVERRIHGVPGQYCRVCALELILMSGHFGNVPFSSVTRYLKKNF